VERERRDRSVRRQDAAPDGLPAPNRLAVVHRLDDAADRALDMVRGHPVADRLIYGLSETGNFSVLWHALAWTPWLLSRSPARLRRAITISTSLMVESVLVNGPIKAQFQRDRPESDASRPHRLRQPRTSSFPSGHASAAMVAAALLSRAQPRLRPLYYATGVAMSASRVYVRLHHASDVAGGLAIGWGLGRVLSPIVPRR
jgi:undecaprenyl-diphosphatase